MKINKLEKTLQKVMEQEFGADGYARIDYVEIDVDGNLITIKGAFGVYKSEADGYHKSFEFTYPDGSGYQFVAGMFYQFITETEELY